MVNFCNKNIFIKLFISYKNNVFKLYTLKSLHESNDKHAISNRIYKDVSKYCYFFLKIKIFCIQNERKQFLRLMRLIILFIEMFELFLSLIKTLNGLSHINTWFKLFLLILYLFILNRNNCHAYKFGNRKLNYQVVIQYHVQFKPLAIRHRKIKGKKK